MTAALLDHLWQSTLFAAAIWLMMPLFRGNSATLRFWLWFAASVKFLVPFSIFAVAGRHLLPSVAPAVGAELVSALRPIAVPFSQQAGPLVLPVPPHLSPIALLTVVWLLGTTALLARWLLRSLQLRAHLIEACDLPLAAPVPVKSGRSSLEPGVLGIWRPVVLLPDGIAQSLSPLEMQAVMAHELCHLRRRDNLLAAVHMLVQALFWFHPLVWWLGDRLVEERELACDEAVLAAGNQPLVYAQTLLKVCRKYIPSPLACAAGVSGAALETRIGIILENRAVDGVGEAKSLLLLAGAALTVMLPLLAGGIAADPVAHFAHRLVSAIVAQATAPSSVAMVSDAVKAEDRPAVHHRRHATTVPATVPARIAVAPTEGMVSEEANVMASAPVIAVPEPDSQVASANAPAASMDDATVMVCRSPQQLRGSHLLGPRVCRSKGEWARLRQQGEDIGPDGRSIVEADSGRNRWQACIPTLAANYSNTGILCF
jgi:beta-lactamase regulating signal transducer with metallopeptidase domain